VKFCNGCKIEKSFSEFHKQKNGKFGLRGRCIQCAYVYNIKTASERSKRYYEKNKEQQRIKAKQRYLENPEKAIQSVLKSRQKHIEKYSAYSKQYELKNKEARLKKAKVWRENNPDKVAKLSIKRRTSEQNRTPEWSNSEAISKIYKLRDRLNNMASSIKYHVDHVIPLNAKLASGLHVIENLRIILASENMSKRNKYEVTL
jgi:hypothetical protein